MFQTRKIHGSAVTHSSAVTTITTMTPDMALELSVEQLISALSKKLLMECARVRPPTTQISRALVATLSAEVRSQKLQRKLQL